MSYNNYYLEEVSCYDCMKCSMKKYRDPYCQSACQTCNYMFPQVFANYNPMSPAVIWYNPSQYPYGNFYGSYLSPTLMF